MEILLPQVQRLRSARLVPRTHRVMPNERRQPDDDIYQEDQTCPAFLVQGH